MPLFGKRRRQPRVKTPDELQLEQQERALVYEAKQLALHGDPDAQAFLQMVLPSRGGRGHKAAPAFAARPSGFEQMKELMELFKLMQGINGQAQPKEDELDRLMRYRKLMAELRKLDGAGVQADSGPGWERALRAFGEGVGVAAEKLMDKYGLADDGDGDDEPLALPSGERQQDEGENVDLFKMFRLLRELREKFEKLPPAEFAHWFLHADPQARAMAEEWAEMNDDEIFESLRQAKNSPETYVPVKKFLAVLLANPAKTQAMAAAIRSELGVSPPTGGGTPLAATGTDDRAPIRTDDGAELIVEHSKRTAL